jgi:hypothetical protein
VNKQEKKLFKELNDSVVNLLGSLASILAEEFDWEDERAVNAVLLEMHEAYEVLQKVPESIHEGYTITDIYEGEN